MKQDLNKASPFAADHAWDRNYFLITVLTIWAGIFLGFGKVILHRYVEHNLNYSLIVHIHAAAFVGWLVLLTTQVLLIRSRNFALHRKLGIGGAALAGAMVVIGPVTQIMLDLRNYGTPDADPAFMSVAFAGIVIFGVLAGAALVLRRQASEHKRLMLLATLAISNAGFSRWLSDDIGKLMHSLPGKLGDSGFLTFWAIMYLVPTLLVLGLGVYDLITRRRLLPAYVAGALFSVAVQVLSIWLYFSPGWLEVTKRIIGH